MLKTFIIRDVNGVVPYWASDENIMDAIARYKKLTGKQPSSKANINMFTGTLEELDKIRITDMGDISYPKETVVNTVIN